MFGSVLFVAAAIITLVTFRNINVTYYTKLLLLEMNVARSFVSTNWEVFVSELGYELGFRCTKTQEYLKKGIDHHKTWNFLEILYIAISLELVTEFVHEFIAKKRTPDIDSYWEWCEKIENRNYLYITNVLQLSSYLNVFKEWNSKMPSCLGLGNKIEILPTIFRRKPPYL